MKRALFWTLLTTTNRERAERSRLIWADREDGVLRLTPLSLINTALFWTFGVEMVIEQVQL